MFKSIRTNLGLVLDLLILIGLISVGTSLWTAQSQSADALVMNLAGRQRLLILRTAKLNFSSAPREQDLTYPTQVGQDLDAAADEADLIFAALWDGGQVEYQGRLVLIPPTTAPTIRAVGNSILVHDNPSMEYILRQRRPLVVADVQRDPILGGVAPLLRELGVQSILILPLIVQDQVIGTIGLDSTRCRRVFTQDEIALAQTVAH